MVSRHKKLPILLCITAFCGVLLVINDTAAAKVLQRWEYGPKYQPMAHISGMGSPGQMLIRYIKNKKFVGKIIIRMDRQQIGLAIYNGSRLPYRRNLRQAFAAGEKIVVLLQRTEETVKLRLINSKREVFMKSPAIVYRTGIAAIYIRTFGSSPIQLSMKSPSNFTGLTPECGKTTQRMVVNKTYCDDASYARIVGGEPAAAGDHPWQVAILEKKGSESDHICGGVLISECAVISAGHCFYFPYPSKYRVRVGDYYNKDDPRGLFRRFEDSRVYEVKKLITRTDYEQRITVRAPINDMTIVAIKKDSAGRCVTFGDFVKPVCLPAPNINIDDHGCRITGWGATEFEQNIAAYTACLRFAQVDIFDPARCRSMYDTGAIVTSSMVCAKGVNSRHQNTDTCQGDSGGPLVCDDRSTRSGVLVGITSFGDKCGGAKPGVYTKVAAFYPWIIDALIDEIDLKSSDVINAIPF